MLNDALILNQISIPPLVHGVPETRYFKTRVEFDEAVGQDFIRHANESVAKNQEFLVGLAHGQSPSGAYEYIADHFPEILKPELIHFTLTNSPLKRQRDLEGILDAGAFLKKLYTAGFITKDQILGRALSRDDLDAYIQEYNKMLSAYLKEQNKEGLDYVFLAADPTGRVAGISRNSNAFNSKEIGVLVYDREEKELTATPHFLTHSKRIAFLATKADKRRPLALLFYRWSKPNKSPSFLRYIDDVENRLVVFVDDKALTWPTVEVLRETPYGTSRIVIDVAYPYNKDSQKKLPVVLLIHGFLGLNSYDALLTTIPAHKYIAAAMHYGSIPKELPPLQYSNHVMQNIDAVVAYFGSNGHPVYIFDHSMGNIYFQMMDHAYQQQPGIKKYLRGRIGANPFFGEETKHAVIGFLDHVLLPSKQGIINKTTLLALRAAIPWDTRSGVRKRAIKQADWLIRKDSTFRDRVWKAAKDRILSLMANLAAIPHLNRIPIEQALNRLPVKIFAIQVRSALEESKAFDKQKGLMNMDKRIPILILKSEKDAVAKFVPRIYEGTNTQIIDVTDLEEKNLFKEHLFHMNHPERTKRIVVAFIKEAEKKRKQTGCRPKSATF